jgi:hypothetical protein
VWRIILSLTGTRGITIFMKLFFKISFKLFFIVHKLTNSIWENGYQPKGLAPQQTLCKSTQCEEYFVLKWDSHNDNIFLDFCNIWSKCHSPSLECSLTWMEIFDIWGNIYRWKGLLPQQTLSKSFLCEHRSCS